MIRMKTAVDNQGNVGLEMGVQINEKYIIKKYLGIPYQHRGDTLAGLNCWNLNRMIYRDLGHELWTIDEPYNEEWNWKDKNYFIENYHREWRKIERPELFDGVLFKNPHGIAVHSGIVLTRGRFIHCVRYAGVCLGKLTDPQWSDRIQGFYRLKARDNHANN